MRHDQWDVDGRRARPGTCRDCRAKVVYIKHDNGNWSPPLEPPVPYSKKWVPHLCPGEKSPLTRHGLSRRDRLMLGCRVHVIRRSTGHGYAAFNRAGGRLVSTRLLDPGCAKALKELRANG